MAAFKDKNGKWFVSFRITDWKGERKQKLKRGFTTKREALEYERQYLLRHKKNLDMPFQSFVEVYATDIKPRLKLNTWLTKNAIIQKKIIPYFKGAAMNEITPADVIAWQNEMLAYRNEAGDPYSPIYLKTLHNQLSAIFNHAVRFYELASNPATKAGNMGKEKTKEMLFWTKEEYLQFADEMMDKPISYYAFEMLYWCGIRVGELLALTAADFDFSKNKVSINKSYQRLERQDVITDPKTPKSKRIIKCRYFYPRRCGIT